MVSAAQTKKALAESLKPKVCNRRRRRLTNDSIPRVVIEKCGREYLGNNPCPEKDSHLLAFPTGQCSAGWHEGSKAVTATGKPAPSCKYYVTCPCDCHGEFDRLFAMTDRERILVEASAYHSPHRTYWMPSDEITEPEPAPSIPDDIPAPESVESPEDRIVPPSITRSFTPGESGRAPKGQLEAWVKEACDVWVIDQPGFPCTPVWVANEIAYTQAIPAPSVGAIDATFNRWLDLGFATIEKKPTRFVGYTKEGIELGLDKMKRNAKTTARLKRADDRRNLRR